MQSQQKRVKWSRGETAEALEERTDTGITVASVELMENCIPDIYGNISRRPALKPIPFGEHYFDAIPFSYGFKYARLIEIVPFYISENDYILIGIHDIDTAEFIRIKNGECVYRKSLGSTQYPQALGSLGKVTSYTQQNNYLLIAGDTKVVKVTITLAAWNDYEFTPNVEFWEYSAGWYAPNGTQTKSVSTTQVPGMSISGNFTNYVYTDVAKNTTAYSQTDTGLDGQTNLDLIKSNIPLGSIVTLPNIGTYMRVEGYYLSSNNVMMFGALLTPVADSSATDSTVSVEYGYINLTPDSFTPGASYTNSVYPHPEQLCFNNQRLWAGSWTLLNSSKTEHYSVVIGSQIARYNDFKNDYNQENEAISLDILTKYKEKIIHLIDYNGLKIFTDSFEYAYDGSGVVKQSANGALESCDPIVFESLCLYVDKTGSQVRAMQYELQSNIFNSSCINQMAPHDLVWFPVGMASYEDKTNSTGKYLFLANTLNGTTPTLAVCNFVPSNQAMIWNRWTLPKLVEGYSRLFNVLDMKDNAIFLVVCVTYTDVSPYPRSYSVIPCVLDFNSPADLLCDVTAEGNVNISTYLNMCLTLANVEVNVYSNGEYKFTTTTSNYGGINPTLIADLPNVTAGMKIQSTIRSHPIDVGGKTKSIMKRIGKAQISVHDTEDGAITINNKTGYMNPRKDHICFYGVTGMKDEIRYTITNNNGAMFHLESLLMNIEYGTLDS